MDVNEFERIFEEQVEKIRDTLVTKAREYADDGDRMHNFKSAAAMNRETPEQALWGFVTKQIISVRDMVQSGKSYDKAQWDEKLGDILTYGFLLRALVEDTGSATPNRNRFSDSNSESVMYSEFNQDANN